MTAPATFPIITADEQLRERFGSTVTLLDAATAVVELDRAEGRVVYALETVEVLQVTPGTRHGRCPPFFVHRVEGREGRPRGMAEDPLSIDAARAAGQHFLAVDTPAGALLALANPFAYAPMCVTWATTAALHQQCGDAEGETPWARAFDMLLFICDQLRGHVVGFNERVGNSLERLHVVSHVPPKGFGPYPVQLAFADRKEPIAYIGGDAYPTHVWRLDAGDNGATRDAATALMDGWRSVAGPFASANVSAMYENGRSVLYLTPRHRRLRAIGWKSPAFLELAGLFIASSEAFAQVENGAWGFDHFWQLLSSLRISGDASERINRHLQATGSPGLAPCE